MRFYSAVRCNSERVTATYNLACHCNLIKRSADNKMRGDVSGQDETKMKLEKRRWEEERWDERKPDEEIGGEDRMGEEMRTGRKIWAEERSSHKRRREDMRGYERKSTGVFPGFFLRVWHRGDDRKSSAENARCGLQSRVQPCDAIQMAICEKQHCTSFCVE